MLITLGATGWSSDNDHIALTQREAALLAYLNDHAPRTVRRESLANLFWPRSPTLRALRSLSQLHYQVRKRIHDVSWISDAKTIGIRPIPTDIEKLASCVTKKAFSQALNMFGGPFLVEPLQWSKELELWQNGKTGELLDLLDKVLDVTIEHLPQQRDTRKLARAIDGILRSGVSTRTLLLARILLHIRDDQINAARELFAELERDFGAPASLDALVASAREPGLDASQDKVGPIPFVGRKEELGGLRSILRDALEGRGGVVVLKGEAGIGKTRLARHLLRLAAISGARIWTAEAHQATRRVRFATLSELLEKNWKMWSAPGQDAPWVDHIRGRAPGANATGSYPRLALLEWMAAILEAEMQKSPLVLYIDDAQWVDDFTAQLLLFLAVRAPRLSLLLLLTVRTAEPDATPDWLAYELPNAKHVDVGQLSVEDAAQLVRTFEEHRGIQLDDIKRKHVLWHTAGRPLLLMEMLTAVSGDAKYEIAESGIILPESTEAVLRRRFTGLGHLAVWVYGIVASVGKPMNVSDLIRLAAIDHKQAAESLEVLSERGILELSGGDVAYPHDILREVAYRTLALSTKAIIHRRIADFTLETHGDVGETATHLAAAGGGNEAAKYALIAAADAGREGRFADREFYYKLAVDNADDMTRNDAAIALARHLIEAHRGTEVMPLIPILQMEPAKQEGQLLAELARLGERIKHGDLRPDQVVAAASSVTDILSRIEASELAPAIETIMDVILDAPDLAAGDKIVSEVSTLARESGDSAIVYHARCMALLWDCVTRGYEAPLAAVISTADNPTTFRRRAGFGFFARGTIFMVAGRLDAARQDLEKALTLANDQGDEVRASAASANLGVVLTELADLSSAKKHLEANLTSPNFTHRLRCYANLAILAYESGDYDDSITTAQNLLRANEHYRAEKYDNTAHAVIGLSEMRQGDNSRALHTLSRVLDRTAMMLAATGDVGYIGSFAGRALALLHNDVDGAIELLTRCASSAKGRDALGHLRLNLARAEVLAISGRSAAYPEAKAVFRSCDSLGAAVLSKQARDLMQSTRA